MWCFITSCEWVFAQSISTVKDVFDNLSSNRQLKLQTGTSCVCQDKVRHFYWVIKASSSGRTDGAHVWIETVQWYAAVQNHYNVSRCVFCVFLSVISSPSLLPTPFTCAHLSSAVPCHQSLSPQYLASPFFHSICQMTFTVTDLVYSWSFVSDGNWTALLRLLD